MVGSRSALSLGRLNCFDDLLSTSATVSLFLGHLIGFLTPALTRHDTVKQASPFSLVMGVLPGGFPDDAVFWGVVAVVVDDNDEELVVVLELELELELVVVVAVVVGGGGWDGGCWLWRRESDSR